MKINSQEMLLSKIKNVKIAEMKNQPTPVIEPPVSKPDATLNALELQGQNNIAFQSSLTRGAKKALLGAMALATVATSCIDIKQDVEVVIDESLIQQIKDSIEEGNAEQARILNLILAELEKGNQISAENRALLIKILNATNQLDANDKEGLALLTLILEKINEAMTNGEEMDAKVLALLDVIIVNQKDFNAEQKELLLALIEKVGDIDENILASFTTLYGKMDNMSNEGKDLANKILEAVLENNKISTTNSNLLSQIVLQLSGLDANDKAAIEVLKMIWDMLGKHIENDKDMNEKQQELLKLILENVQNFKEDNTKLMSAIMNKIDKLDANDELAFGLLEKILVVMDKYMQEDQVIDGKTQELLITIIEKMDKLDANDKTQFEYMDKVIAIIDYYMQQDQVIDGKTQEILLTIVDKMDKLDANDKMQFEYMDKVIAIIEHYMQQDQVIDGKTQEILLTIVDKIDNLDTSDETVNKLLEKILATVEKFMQNEQTMDAKDQELMMTIIEKMDKLGNAGQEALLKLLEAIDRNTKVAEGTQILVKELLEKADKLGVKADKIIETLANMSTGGNVDLSEIETMLADILAQQKANGNILTSQEAKLALIEVTLQAFMKQEAANDAAVQKKLQEILDKIPAGCNCGNVDLTVIINKLDKIIENMKDGKNEGILGDLGNLEDLLG